MEDIYADMLEAAFPYVSNKMKHPIATLLKIQELQRVCNDFDTDGMIRACNLDSSNINIEQMLMAMKARATPEVASQIEMILNTMNMMKIYQNYQEFLQKNPSLSSSMETNSSSSDMLTSLLSDLIKKNS